MYSSIQWLGHLDSWLVSQRFWLDAWIMQRFLIIMHLVKWWYRSVCHGKWNCLRFTMCWSLIRCRLSGTTTMFLITFVMWWIWQAFRFIMDYPVLKDMHNFYHHLLEIPDVSWSFITNAEEIMTFVYRKISKQCRGRLYYKKSATSVKPIPIQHNHHLFVSVNMTSPVVSCVKRTIWLHFSTKRHSTLQSHYLIFATCTCLLEIWNGMYLFVSWVMHSSPMVSSENGSCRIRIESC